ncbi:hypothetical protein ACI65C_007661 [Semiaphis heraclei]
MDNHNKNKKCFSIFNFSTKKDSYINDEQPDSVPHVIAPVMSSSPHASVTTVSTITISHQLNPNTECDLGTLETGPVQPILKLAGSRDAKQKKTKLQLHSQRNLVKGIISTLENNRNGEHFSELWDNIKTFCLEHNILINILVQGLKRPRKEPTYLNEYDVTVSTAAEQTNNCLSDNDSNQKQYWKLNAFYVIMDSIICSMKTRFSEESLSIATSADQLMQFDYEGSSFLVEHYKDVLNINETDLKSEMLVFKNVIGDNLKDFNFIKQNLNKKVFPNLYLMPSTCDVVNGVEKNLESALEFADMTQSTIKQIRDNANAEFEKIFKEVEDVCSSFDITVSVPRTTSRQKNRSNVMNNNPIEYYRISTFIPFLDNFLEQLHGRFLEHRAKLKSFNCLLPKTSKQISEETFEDFKIMFNFYTDILSDSINLTSLEVGYGELKLCYVVSSAYIPPNSSTHLYESYLSAFQSVINDNSNSLLLLCGDFNLPDINWSNNNLGLTFSSTSDIRINCLPETFALLNYYQLNKVLNTDGKLLDLIFCNNELASVETVLDTLVPCDPYHPAHNVSVEPAVDPYL